MLDIHEKITSVLLIKMYAVNDSNINMSTTYL